MAGTVPYKVGATVLAEDVPMVNGQAALLKWQLLDKPAGWTPLITAQFPKLILAECAIGVGIVLLVGLL